MEIEETSATCLHHIDTEDHKCFEASSTASSFAVKGITDKDSCPSTYNTVDKTQVVTQCPDGVTNPRYCSPINVTISTKGEAMAEALVATSTCLHHIDEE